MVLATAESEEVIRWYWNHKNNAAVPETSPYGMNDHSWLNSAKWDDTEWRGNRWQYGTCWNFVGG